jgi:hypothetical protein
MADFNYSPSAAGFCTKLRNKAYCGLHAASEGAAFSLGVSTHHYSGFSGCARAASGWFCNAGIRRALAIDCQRFRDTNKPDATGLWRPGHSDKDLS